MAQVLIDVLDWWVIRINSFKMMVRIWFWVLTVIPLKIVPITTCRVTISGLLSHLTHYNLWITPVKYVLLLLNKMKMNRVCSPPCTLSNRIFYAVVCFYFTLYFPFNSSAAELFVSVFHSFKSGIANAISNFKWGKTFPFCYDRHLITWVIWLTEHLP